MRRITSILATLLLVMLPSMGVHAADVVAESPWVGSAVENGQTYYLYNPAAKAFLTGANSWGTQASLGQDGLPFIAEGAEGVYVFNGVIGNGGNNHYLGNGGYIDSGAAQFTLTEVQSGVYTIGWDGNYYASAEGSTVVATVTELSEACYWQFVTQEDIHAGMANATVDNPLNVTSLLACANFGRNNMDISYWQGGPVQGGNNDNMCAEKWNTNYDVYQTISVPNGVYKVSAQGFYRMGLPDAAASSWETSSHISHAKFYANGEAVDFPAIFSEVGNYSGDGTSTSVGIIPNSMNQASLAFTAGLYQMEITNVAVLDGQLTIGFSKETLVDGDWTIFDNVQIEYLGSGDESILMGSGALTSVSEGDHFVYYTDTEGKHHFLNAAGQNNWVVVDDPTTIAFSAGNTTNGFARAASFMASNGFYMSNAANSDGSGAIKTELVTGSNGQQKRTWESQVFYKNAAGKYAIRLTNSIGTSWGANCFVNIDPATLAVVSGQPTLGDALYLWEIADGDDPRFSTKQLEGIIAKAEAITGNCNKDVRAALDAAIAAAKAATIDELVTVKAQLEEAIAAAEASVADYAALADGISLYEPFYVEGAGGATAFHEALTLAKEGYANGTADASTLSALTQAHATYMSNNEIDAIVNGTFDAPNQKSGWTDGVGSMNTGGHNIWTNVNGGFVEKWQNTLPDLDFYQDIEGLPAGTYTFAVYVVACQQSQPDSYEVSGVKVYANDASVDVHTINVDRNPTNRATGAELVMVTTTIGAGETLRVGMSVTSTDANWVVMDNAKLYCFAPSEDMLNAAKEELSALLTAAGNIAPTYSAGAKAQLDEAVATGNAALSATTRDQIATAISALEAAIARAERSIAINEIALSSSPLISFTPIVTNPDMSDGTIKGWTTTPGWQYQASTHQGTGSTISQFQEQWTSGGLGNISSKQTLTDMPNGTYTITADVIATVQYMGGDAQANTTGAYWVANDDAVAIATYDGSPEKVSVTTTVTDGTLTIGLVGINTTANWVAFDNVKVTYYNENVGSEIIEQGYCYADGILILYKDFDFGSPEEYPWHSVREEITSVTILNSTKIGAWAFHLLQNLTSITIPEGITTIGYEAFFHCNNLTTVTLPESLTAIEGYAFEWCQSLTAITIPTNVTTIDYGAFWDCQSLTAITIPSSVTYIGQSAFACCNSLNTIVVEEGNTVYDSRNGCNAIIETATNKLIQGCNTTIIPEDVTIIGAYAFYQCTFTDIVIPEGVTTIENYAFQNCYNLTNITLPGSVTSIGDWAFSNCSSFTNVTLPSSVTSIGEGAFANCVNLSSIVVEEGNTVYDSRNGCNAIIETATNKLIQGCNTTIIPEDVTIIGAYAFQSLSCTDIVIPEGVTTIENSAFQNCSLTNVTLPGSVTSIGDWAFSNCYYLTNITLPSSVTSIGEYAFAWCNNLQTVYCQSPTPVSYPETAFEGETNIQTLYVPSLAAVEFYKASEYWGHIEDIRSIKARQYTFMMGDNLIEQGILDMGTKLTYPDMPKEGHTLNWSTVKWSVNPINIADNADAMLYTNAPCTNTNWGDQFVGWHVLFDGNASTFFHSEYSGGVESTDGLEHYLRVDMGEGNSINWFTFTYTTRANCNNTGQPTRIIVEGSNEADGQYEEIAVLTELPTTGDAIYESERLGNGKSYRYIRYRVTDNWANDRPAADHPYFYFAEFGMSQHVMEVSDKAPEVMPEENFIAIGTYSVNKYLVTFKIGQEVISSEAIEYGAAIVAPEAPEKEGRMFRWNDVKSVVPAADVVIEGEYSYFVTFKVDGVEYAKYTFYSGDEVTVPGDPEKEWHEFDDWADLPETMPAKDITTEANFIFLLEPGDINGDDRVSVLDVALLTNRILGKTNTGTFVDKAADVNGDGRFSIVDITMMTNKILE